MDPRTCILEEPDPDLKRQSTAVFEQIRKAEQRRIKRSATVRGDNREFNAQTNPYSRVFPFQVVVAIRIAAEQRAVAYLDQQLKRESSSDQRVAKSAPGVTPFAPPLWELYKATHRLADATTGRLDDYYYLDRILRISCKHIKHTMSTTDDVLCLFLQAIRRFKTLASFTCHEDRLPHLVSKPLMGEGKNAAPREWRVSDWSYFDEITIDWERVLEVGYSLYQAQLCVALWQHVAPAQCAIALCLVATSGVLRDVLPQQLNIIRELCLEFGLTDNVTNERFRDVKKFVISWSTSLKDLDLPYPQVNPPRVGGLGDGFKNYASDLRRGIPEQEILAAVTVDVATHWKEIAQSRLRTRRDGRPFAEELKDARGQAAAAGMRLEPLMMSRKLRETNASIEFACAMLESIDPPEGMIGGDEDEYEEQEDGPTLPPPTPPLHPARTREDGLEALLEEDEKSSDGGSAYSTDDDADRPRKRTKATPLTGYGLDLSGLGDSDEPFAFTIGPDGFSRAKDSAPRPANGDARRVNKSMPVPQPLASSSGVSGASHRMERQGSNSTILSEYGYSASETERILLSRNWLAGRKPPRKTISRTSRGTSVTSESSKRSATLSASASSLPLPTTPEMSTTPLRDMASLSGFGSDNGFRAMGMMNEDAFRGILEREKRFYTTNRNASRAAAQAKRDQVKAERLAAGWVLGPFGYRRIDAEGSAPAESAESDVESQAPSGKGRGKKRKVSRLNTLIDPVVAGSIPDSVHLGDGGLPPRLVSFPAEDDEKEEE